MADDSIRAAPSSVEWRTLQESMKPKEPISTAILKGEEKSWTPAVAVNADEQIKGIMKVLPANIHGRVLVAGDPSRIKYIATLLENPTVVGDNREYYTVSGKYKGVPVTLASHGVGGGGASMAFHELIDCGARCIIRAGTCGSFQPHLKEGSLIVISGAVRRDGVSDLLVPLAYPAMAHHKVISALEEVCTNHNPAFSWDIGLAVTEGVFYDGPSGNQNVFWQKCGVKCVEMEASVLMTMGQLRGIKTGAIMNVDNYIFERLSDNGEGYKPHRAVVKDGTERMCKIALEAIIKIPI